MTSPRTSRLLGGIVALLAAILLVAAAFTGPVAAHSGDDGLHHHDGWLGMHDGAGGWFGTGLGFLWMLLWTVVIFGIPIGLAYLLLTSRGEESNAGTEALEVLRSRYARGEIDEEEFDTRRRKLQSEQR